MARCFVFIVSIVFLLFFIPYAGAQEHGGEQRSKESWYHITFFCLKPGNAIRNARFMLKENGILAFEIQGEPLKITKNEYKRENFRFTATVAFDVKKGKLYHYVLTFDGVCFADMYGGMATLQEYINSTTAVQKLPFLFFATPEETTDQRNRRPFFLP